jgi:hypothetical protein
VRELIRLDGERIAESGPPAELPGDKVTVLDVDGSLFFAGARTLADARPSPANAKRPAVILRLAWIHERGCDSSPPTSSSALRPDRRWPTPAHGSGACATERK